MSSRTNAAGAQIPESTHIYAGRPVFVTATGALRAAPDGEHVRAVERDGTTADGGSAYWTSEEIAEDPVLCMGAVVAAAGGGRVGGTVGSAARLGRRCRRRGAG